MAQQEIAYRPLGNADEGAVEHLQHISEDGAVTMIGRNQQMRRFVEDEEAVEAALLDQDAVAPDIGETADLRVGKAGDEVERRYLAPAGGEDGGNERPRLGLAHDAMPLGIAGEKRVLEAAERRAIIPLGLVERQCGGNTFAEHEFRRVPKPSLHEPTAEP